MTAKQILTVIIKILALFFALNALLAAPLLMSYLWPRTPMLSFAFITPLICFIISLMGVVILWKLAGSFQKSIDNIEDKRIILNLSAYDFEKIIL